MRLPRTRRSRPTEPDGQPDDGQVTGVAAFISGLSVGALAGAIVVGSAVLRRSGGRRAARRDDANAP